MFDLCCQWNIQRSCLNNRNDHPFTRSYYAIIARPLFTVCTHLSAFRCQCITSWCLVPTSVSTGSKNVSLWVSSLGRCLRGYLGRCWRSKLCFQERAKTLLTLYIAYSHNKNGNFGGGCRRGVREDDKRCSEIKNERWNDRQLKKLLIVKQIFLVSAREIAQKQYGKYAYWCYDVKGWI